MKMRRPAIVLALLASTAYWTGCAAGPGGTPSLQAGSQGSEESRATPALATPSPLLLALAGDEIDLHDWEHSRNDVSRRIDRPADAEWIWVEVRHREYLRTISGRPSEYTTTRSQSIRRRVQ